MKRSRLTPLLTAAFLLAVAVYISYQVAANLTQQIQTVDALEVTVEDKIPARGYFIREQITVPGGSGMMMQEKEGGFVLPAGGELFLEPGKDHFMFMDLTGPITTGQEIPMVLTFDDGTEQDITLTARDFKGGEEEYVGDDHGSHGGGEGANHDG